MNGNGGEEGRGKETGLHQATMFQLSQHVTTMLVKKKSEELSTD